MKSFKKYLKIIGVALAILIGPTLFYVTLALILPRITVNAQAVPNDDVTIYIKSNGVHTDIIVPAKTAIKDWTQQIHYRHTQANDSTAQYLAFGWGDRGFYLNTPTWADLKVSTACNAAFYLGTSIMHTEYYNEVTESQTCKKIQISRENYIKLVGYISESFYRDDQQNFVVIPNNSYGKYDAFYEGTGKYSLFKTCNTWANAGLKAANQKAALWTPTDTGIFRHYQ